GARDSEPAVQVAPGASHERLPEQHGEPRREHRGVNAHEGCRGLDAGEARVGARREPHQDQRYVDDRHAGVVGVTAIAARIAPRRERVRGGARLRCRRGARSSAPRTPPGSALCRRPPCRRSSRDGDRCAHPESLPWVSLFGMDDAGTLLAAAADAEVRYGYAAYVREAPQRVTTPDVAGGPMEQPTPSPDAVRAQLDKILASAAFRGANRSSALLRFVVTAALEGRSQYIKEYTLGTEVLGRSNAFDSRVDPIVRVEA